MKKLFICIALFSCSPGSNQAQTPISNVDSVFTVLRGLEIERQAHPDPTTNAAKKIYAEEIFKYRMIDTLGVQFPIIFNKPDSVISARIDSIILKHGHPDSTTDRGRLIGNRIDAFLALSVAERKSRIKAHKFLGLILYASRNQLLAVTERYDYQINSATKLQAIKKLVIGRLHASSGTSFIAYSFLSTTAFDNKVSALRGLYFESEIK